jgi:hypothetical protein
MCKHVDETTKAPKILAKVKKIFENNQSAYERCYIAPKIINRKLRGWYSRNADIHKKERIMIEKAYYLMQSSKTLKEVAEVCSLDYSTIDYNNDDNRLHPLLKNYAVKKDEPLDDPMISIIEKMSEGEIYKNIVEDDNSYKIVKLLQKNEPNYAVEVISVRKRPFTEWFHEQTAKISVEIFDTELKKEIIAKYPVIWWVEKLGTRH